MIQMSHFLDSNPTKPHPSGYTISEEVIRDVRYSVRRYEKFAVIHQICENGSFKSESLWLIYRNKLGDVIERCIEVTKKTNTIIRVTDAWIRGRYVNVVYVLTSNNRGKNRCFRTRIN